MKYAKRMLMVAGALALAGILGIAIAPKAAHGIVAAMVQVMNTSANPVPNQDVDNAARHVVRLRQEGSAAVTVTTQVPLNDVTMGNPGVPYVVPAGQRLVLEQASVFAYPPNSTSKINVYWSNGFTNTIVPLTQQAFGILMGSTPLRDYVDPGQQVVLLISSDSTTGTYAWDVSAEGYLVACNGAC
jgi:hypothetical protein